MGQQERRVLPEFTRALPELRIDDEVWRTAHEMAHRARAQGITVPRMDVLLAAYVRCYGVVLDTADSDFELLAYVTGPMQ